MTDLELRVLFAGVPYGIVITNSSLEILWQNEASYHFLPQNANTILLTELLPSVLWARVAKELDCGLPATVALKNKSGKHIILSFLPFSDSYSKKCLCSLSDGNRTYDMISASVVHDLSSSISLARKTLKLMLDTNMAQRSELMDIVERNLNAATSLLYSLTSMSSDGIENSVRNTENIFIDKFTQRICREFAIVAGEVGVKLDFFTAENNVPYLINATLYERVLSNIIGNAIKFCRSVVSIKMIYCESYITISIADDGRGIGKDAELFMNAPFTSPDSLLRGGSGLFIAKSIIAAMNGTIKLSRNSGEGTCFDVMLPRNGIGSASQSEHNKNADLARDETDRPIKYRPTLNY